MTLSRFTASAWESRRRLLGEEEYGSFDAVLQIVGAEAAPLTAAFTAANKKRGNDELPQLITVDGGATVVRLRWKKAKSVFEYLEDIRGALSPLLGARRIAVDIRVPAAVQPAVFGALVAAARLPGDSRAPCRFFFFGGTTNMATAAATAASANIMARALCCLPPNVLTVEEFAKTAAAWGKQEKLTTKVYNAKELAQMGAGAILAVGRASESPPRIVHLRYNGSGKKAPRIVLIGKGVCYDTGGVNVKPARHMRGMKKDMGGAAAALAAILAAAAQQLPLHVDAYLALADNVGGPRAYYPDEVITSLSGKRIEIVHSDAEGRMILADTLTLASRQKPRADLMITFATLTGTMHVALGERMSGVFSTDSSWLKKALYAAEVSGERLCAFPLAADYRRALKSTSADIKQCAEAGEADHIRAALFLHEFIQNSPSWLHLDLSAVSCEGGLGAAPGPETGFGAVWALSLLKRAAE